MSDLDTTQTGAPQAAPAEEQVVSSTPATEQTEAQTQEQPRDESGKFIPRERFNEVYGQKKQAERQALELRQQVEYLQSQLQQPQQQATSSIPDPAEYGFDMAKWGEAVTQHATRAAQEQAIRQMTEQQQQAYQQQVFSTFDQRERAYMAEHPDYPERVQTLQMAVELHPQFVEALALSDHGPAVVDYLALHLEEADKISRMPPHIAAMHLGRIEAQVSSPKTKPVSTAPTPAPVLKGGTQPAAKDPTQMSDDEWYQHNKRGSR